MSSTSARGELVTSASGLMALLESSQWITTTNRGTYVDFCADPVTKYLVTFEMTIKPLPEELSTSGSHPLTDGLDK